MTYIVASPGRCGSIFLSTFLQEYCQIDQNKMFYLFSVLPSFKDLENLPSNFVIHCHNIEAIPIFSQNRKLIIITRNPIEIAISHLIAVQTKVYHFGVGEYSNVLVDQYKEKYSNHQFEIPMNPFIKWVKEIMQWYVDTYQYSDHATILNYHQAVNIEEFSKILNLKSITIPSTSLTKAQPLKKWEIVKGANKFKEVGNLIFNEYQSKYPHIFTEEKFKY